MHGHALGLWQVLRPGHPSVVVVYGAALPGELPPPLLPPLSLLLPLLPPPPPPPSPPSEPGAECPDDAELSTNPTAGMSKMLPCPCPSWAVSEADVLHSVLNRSSSWCWKASCAAWW